MNDPVFSTGVHDAYNDKKVHEIIVEPEREGVSISFPGYGDLTSADGHGSPVYIEYRGGIPYVVVWADINQEDPTHVISLFDANEKLRRKDE